MLYSTPDDILIKLIMAAIPTPLRATSSSEEVQAQLSSLSTSKEDTSLIS